MAKEIKVGEILAKEIEDQNFDDILTGYFDIEFGAKKCEEHENHILRTQFILQENLLNNLPNDLLNIVKGMYHTRPIYLNLSNTVDDPIFLTMSKSFDFYRLFNKLRKGEFVFIIELMPGDPYYVEELANGSISYGISYADLGSVFGDIYGCFKWATEMVHSGRIFSEIGHIEEHTNDHKDINYKTTTDVYELFKKSVAEKDYRVNYLRDECIPCIHANGLSGSFDDL